mmetsp:Transcript_97884/g.281213  ORF Transcript_97884/g.281213 Transcript_97884/m.281213 type:complete len:272 (+) Transcript_97884:588-1403(+)
MGHEGRRLSDLRSHHLHLPGLLLLRIHRPLPVLILAVGTLANRVAILVRLAWRLRLAPGPLPLLGQGLAQKELGPEILHLGERLRPGFYSRVHLRHHGGLALGADADLCRELAVEGLPVDGGPRLAGRLQRAVQHVALKVEEEDGGGASLLDAFLHLLHLPVRRTHQLIDLALLLGHVAANEDVAVLARHQLLLGGHLHRRLLRCHVLLDDLGLNWRWRRRAGGNPRRNSTAAAKLIGVLVVVHGAFGRSFRRGELLPALAQEESLARGLV